MDTKLYIEWRNRLGEWHVKFQGAVVSKHQTQAEAEKWVRRYYPNHGYEIERVVVRENSPRGVHIGEWR
jgi:hypothetical protein